MESKQTNLEKLKEAYGEKSKKYSLPTFSELAEEFDIERFVEKNTSFVLRDIRRAINEKLSAYLHLFETFMNPSSVPVFMFSMIKNMTEEDKKIIKEMYQQLAKKEMEILRLDTLYNEKNEADFIINASKDWKEMKNKIYKLIEKLEGDFSKDSISGSRGYFG